MENGHTESGNEYKAYYREFSPNYSPTGDNLRRRPLSTYTEREKKKLFVDKETSAGDVKKVPSRKTKFFLLAFILINLGAVVFIYYGEESKVFLNDVKSKIIHEIMGRKELLFGKKDEGKPVTEPPTPESVKQTEDIPVESDNIGTLAAKEGDVVSPSEEANEGLDQGEIKSEDTVINTPLHVDQKEAPIQGEENLENVQSQAEEVKETVVTSPDIRVEEDGGDLLSHMESESNAHKNVLEKNEHAAVKDESPSLEAMSEKSSLGTEEQDASSVPLEESVGDINSQDKPDTEALSGETDQNNIPVHTDGIAPEEREMEQPTLTEDKDEVIADEQLDTGIQSETGSTVKDPAPELMAPVTGETQDSVSEQKTTETSPLSEENAPVIEENAPLSGETAPLSEENAPLSEGNASPAAETAPPAAETAPLTEEAVPLAEEAVPLAEEAVPLSDEAAPFPTEDTEKIVKDHIPTPEVQIIEPTEKEDNVPLVDDSFVDKAQMVVPETLDTSTAGEISPATKVAEDKAFTSDDVNTDSSQGGVDSSGDVSNSSPEPVPVSNTNVDDEPQFDN